MKTDRLPTEKEIKELVAFLPQLYAKGFQPVIKWHGGRRSGGVFELPRPEYNPVVEDFFRLASQDVWCDFDYDPVRTGDDLQTPGFIQKASLSEIRTLLTFCVRGERFCDGHWGAMIEQGYIRSILERLTEI